MLKETPEKIIERARDLLEQRHPEVAQHLMVESEYLQEGQWLYLVIVPKKEGISALDFLDAIEGIERELHRVYGNKITIVSSKAEAV